MTSFWLLSIGLALLAVLFIALPAFKLRSVNIPIAQQEHEDRERQNVLIFRDRLAEIEADLASGKINQSEFDALKQELELALLEDIEEAETHSTAIYKASQTSIVVSCVVAVLVIVTSYIAYFQTGNYEKVLDRQAMMFDQGEVRKAQAAAERGDMSALLKQLYDKLQNSRDNAEGWMLLGRTAMNTERFDLAVEAFNQLIGILEKNGDDPAPVFGLLAQAHYFGKDGVTQTGEMSDATQRAAAQALRLNSSEINTLGLYAIHAFDTGDYQGAIDNWQKILTVAPDHPSRASIESGIVRASQLLGLTPSEKIENKTTSDEMIESDNSPETGEAWVQVTVNLDPSVKELAGQNDFVFIFARSDTGPPMPLAASRHRVSDLPVTVTLNDAKAMAPMAKLSQVDKANIIARVSKSGQPIAQPGDLEGRENGVSVNSQQKVTISINTRL